MTVDVSLHDVRIDVDPRHPVSQVPYERVVRSSADSAHAQDQDFSLGNVDRPFLRETLVGLEAQQPRPEAVVDAGRGGVHR